MNFDLIIFDCDGTICDSESVNNNALLQVLHEEGHTQYDMAHVLKHWAGTTYSTIILEVQMTSGRKMPEDSVKRMIDRASLLQRGGLIPIAGAPDLIAAAKKKLKICVASNGERMNVLNALDSTGLMDYFSPETVFTKNQVKNPKPFPDLFLYAAAQMGAEPDRCLVIEDSAAGVRAGVAAGMTTWGFTGSAHDPAKQAQTLKSAGAHLVFERLIHIQAALGL